MGKSFIVACIALMACISSKYSCITIVVPNNYLLHRDQERFAPLFRNHSQQISYTDQIDFEVQNNHSNQISYTNAIDFEVQLNHLIIIDEADDLLYKQSAAFFKIGASKQRCKNVVNKPRIVCFTATKGQDNDLWHSLLASQDYTELSYWPSNLAVPAGVITSLDKA